MVAQPRRGFRYGSEAFWLVGFALELGPAASALDLGTGSGIVAALLARHGVHATGVDIREEWQRCWDETLFRSELPVPLLLQHHDLASPMRGEYDLVLSNPPYFTARSGPASPDSWKAAARTESTAALTRFVEVAAACVAPAGRACFVVPLARGDTLVEAADGNGLGVVERVQVGARRELIALSRTCETPCSRQRLSETDPRVLRWLELARGLPLGLRRHSVDP